MVDERNCLVRTFLGNAPSQVSAIVEKLTLEVSNPGKRRRLVGWLQCRSRKPPGQRFLGRKTPGTAFVIPH
jgi:hypothetical protein